MVIGVFLFMIIALVLGYFIFRKPKRVAIVLRGISYSETYRNGVDWRACLDSFAKNIVKPLQKKGFDISIYLATYAHEHQHQLVESYKPYLKKHMFIEKRIEESTQKESVLESLSLIKEDISLYDFVMMTRFDVSYKKPIDEWNIDWDKINLPWREIEELWKEHQRVGDIMHLFPATYYSAVCNAIQISEASNTFHHLYNDLLKQPGVTTHTIHFLLPDFYDSKPDYPNPLWRTHCGR